MNFEGQGEVFIDGVKVGESVGTVEMRVSRESFFGVSRGATRGTYTAQGTCFEWLDLAAALLGRREAWDALMRNVLWRRVHYGGRKGRRAFRRLFPRRSS